MYNYAMEQRLIAQKLIIAPQNKPEKIMKDAISGISPVLLVLTILLLAGTITHILKHRDDIHFIKKYITITFLGGLVGFITLIIFALISQYLHLMQFAIFPFFAFLFTPIITTYFINLKFKGDHKDKITYLVGGPFFYLLLITIALQMIALMT
jgi:hypothetical protein